MNTAAAVTRPDSHEAYRKLLPYEQQLADAWAGMSLELRAWLIRQAKENVHPITDFEQMAPATREALRTAAWKTARLAGQLRGMLV